MERAEEPRWLSGEEREVWLTLVAVMMKLPGALDAQLQQDAESGLGRIGPRILQTDASRWPR